MPQDDLGEVIALLEERGDSITVVAVDGHSAAGKSTFAGALAERIPAAVVAGDDFYRVMPATTSIESWTRTSVRRSPLPRARLGTTERWYFEHLRQPCSFDVVITGSTSR